VSKLKEYSKSDKPGAFLFLFFSSYTASDYFGKGSVFFSQQGKLRTNLQCSLDRGQGRRRETQKGNHGYSKGAAEGGRGEEGGDAQGGWAGEELMLNMAFEPMEWTTGMGCFLSVYYYNNGLLRGD
jgi:hypothetical protein